MCNCLTSPSSGGFLCTGEGPGQPPPVVRSAEEAYRTDAEAYVAAFGGTIDEAVRRLKLQEKIVELDEKLQVHESRVFAGLWIEHTPAFVW